jgi:hypothetical protein
MGFPDPPRTRLRRWVTSNRVAPVMAAVWLGAAVAGSGALWRYSQTAGRPADAITTWPDGGDGSLARDPARPTLVVFLHPHCGCSDATVEELAKLMTYVQRRVAVDVVVFRPSDAAADWQRSTLWSSASRIPGVTMVVDADAREAARFGVYVSGQALLYDAAGRSVFRGGLTFARGHAGDNDGTAAVREWVTRGASATRETPVFGCYLRTPPDQT